MWFKEQRSKEAKIHIASSSVKIRRAITNPQPRKKTPEQILHERYNAHVKSYYYYEFVKRLSDENTDLFPRDALTENPSLFSALLLKEAGIKDITILEYQDRVGGRVYTHYFTDDPDDERRLYGELGAMRLPYIEGRPDLSIDQIVFDTIEYLNEYNKEDDPDKEIKTIPFIISNPNAINYINNKKDPSGKIMTKNYYYSVDANQLGFPDTIPPDVISIWSEALRPFFDALKVDLTNGIKLLKQYDQYSIYSCLKEVFLPERLPTRSEDYDEIISAIELQVTGGTGVFHLSFAEFVIESFSLKGKKEEVEAFDRVVLTPTLGVIRHWDLPTISYNKRRAIRELNYIPSVKIFLQFKSRFWEKDGQPTTSGLGIVGGTTTTDLPIRTVISPSYYVGLPKNGSGVLLASYNFENDALRYGPYSGEELFELALKNIVTLHGEIAHFAAFTPGQLGKLMSSIIRPEDCIHWAGEHADIRHGLISGALNSAVRVIKEILVENLIKDRWTELKNSRLLKYWNGNLEAFEGN
ncbi:12664_t:CDS:2 [Funneliformis mosseae]|uniref:12664_t:CDS:1 n=1 Tax=Funneliformis mosseae TaxID=27381 RepID=A0A9N8ZWH4_FUNMO|nr:12664_t:CDS:2 [Funneliformis mosseae]